MSRRSRAKRYGKSAGKAALGNLLDLPKAISTFAPYIAFAQQLTAKDMAILPAGRSYTQQGKDFLNILTGRMGGFHLFNAASDYKPPFTINPAAILTSKWVQAGAGMIAYSLAAKRIKVLPKGGKVGSIGKKILFGGAIGALFDAPSGTTTTTSYTAPAPAGSTSTISTHTYSQQIASYPTNTGGIS